MNIRLFATRIQISTVAGLMAVSLCPSRAFAQDDHAHATTSQRQPLTAAQLKQANALVSEVRDATAGFQNPANLPSGYALMFGCVSGSGDEGAMGLLVIAADWDAKHPHDPPQLHGQLFHLFDSPNRFGLDPFYTLHVWAWKDNPNGTFTNWNPNVSCEAFNQEN
jgi:hypothetical protein